MNFAIESMEAVYAPVSFKQVWNAIVDFCKGVVDGFLAK